MSDDVTLTSELEDARAPGPYDWSQVDLADLTSSYAWPRVAGIALALTFLFWPDRSQGVVGLLIAGALVFLSLRALWSMRTSRPIPLVRSAAACAAVGLGVLLAVQPVETETALGRVLGGLLVAKGAWDLLVRRSMSRSEGAWRVASSCAFMAVGALVLAFPSGSLTATLAVIAWVWIGVELIALAVVLDPSRDRELALDDTPALVRQWFADRPKTVDDRQRLYRELFYEGDRVQEKISRFAMLMVLSSIIASMGVISDSTAVVIGAMLIAPLMTPLMAMALSLVMGWPNRLTRSGLVGLGGILVAIAIGFLLGHTEFAVVDTLTNAQVLSRSEPTVIDLVIAAAAGAAGAYGFSRPDVSNSLPGVAIAIALVPPLTIVGISYSQGDWASGHGALLLFSTNVLAILVVGGAMFLLLGVAPVRRVTEHQYRVRTASAVIVSGTALVIGALVLNGSDVASNALEQRSARQVVDDTVAGFPGHLTIETDVDGDVASIVLSGPATGESPTAAGLADELSAELGRAVTVDLRIRLEMQETSG